MAAKKPLPSLTLVDTAWLAGLFEGEGSFIINSTPSNSLEKTHEDSAPFSISFVLTMADEDVVEKAGNMLGLGVTKPKRLTSTNKQTYRISSERRNLVKYFCESVYPFMGERRKEQIDKVLENCREHQIWEAGGGRSRQAQRAQNASTAAKNRSRPEQRGN
jgi:hypothetical protein